MATRTPERVSSAEGVDSSSVAVQVCAATVAARDTVTFALALPGTSRAPAAYRPGQFITLAVPFDGTTLYRSYSLCGDGRADLPWEITVKRATGGVVSNYLIDHLRPGMRLRTSAPVGAFTLPSGLRSGASLIFVAAGSGITPIYGMLRALARLDPAQRPRVQLHYAYHSPADAIFDRQLAALDPERRWLTERRYVSTAGQRLTAEAMLRAAGAEAVSAEWFLCGPLALTRGVRAAALGSGVPQQRVHTEVFASPAARPMRHAFAGAPAGTAAHVRLADSGTVLVAQPGESLLETLERGGYRPDFNCRAGACGTCRLRLLSGSVCGGAGESGALTPDDEAAGYVLSCVARPEGNVTLATAGKRMASVTAVRSGRHGRGSWRMALRSGLSAAAVGLFIGMWGLTGHAAATSSTSAGTTTTSGSSSSSSSTSSSSNTSTASNSSGSSTSGSSTVQTQTGQSSTSTSTGVS